jgi:hypothetical protein
VANATIDLLPQGAAYLDQRITQVDVRLTKLVRFGTRKLQANLDLINMFNGSTVLQVNSTYGPTGSSGRLRSVRHHSLNAASRPRPRATAQLTAYLDTQLRRPVVNVCPGVRVERGDAKIRQLPRRPRHGPV